jgi:hypothetical protein
MVPGEVVLEALHELPPALGPPVADVVVGVDGGAEGDDVVDDVGVPSGVLAQAVDDEEDGFRVVLGEPGLMVDVEVPHGLETAFDVVHGAPL